MDHARALEKTPCPWNGWMCAGAGAGVDCEDPGTLAVGLEGRGSDRFPKTVRERAWTSPIWVHAQE